MSSIDERIVQMQFDNKQFESGIKQSTDSLAGLQKSLNMTGATKGLEELDAAGKRIDLSHVSNGIDNIASKLSTLSVIGVAALATIASKAASVGQSLYNSLQTAPIAEGFADYNRKLTSVQTIMNATGQSIEVVSGYFKELDTYADKTIYNLDDMTGAFAKFTNAGVGMEASVPAIKGIANMVALAGQGADAASIAMYNLSQSIAGGFLTTTDYRSLNLANVATAEWKDNMVAAAVAAGKLEDVGGGAYKIVGGSADRAYDSAALFNEALSEGWASADVLLGVLGDYGDETTDIGKKALAAAQDVKSMSMMIETLKATAGTGWTDTFEILVGNLEEAKALFGPLTKVIGGFLDAQAEARNSLLQSWKDEGGRTAAIDAVKNAFAALMAIVTPIKEAFREVFPPSTGKGLADITKAVRDFTAMLIISEDAQERLKAVAKGFFTVLKFGFDIIGGLVSVLGFLGSALFKMGAAVLGLLVPIIDFFRTLVEGGDQTQEVQDNIDTLGKAFEWLNTYAIAPLVAGLEWLREAFDKLLKGDPTIFANKVKDAFGPLIQLGGDVQDNWSKVGQFLKGAWEFVKPLVDAVGRVIEDLKSGFSSAMEDVDVDTILAAINTGFLALIVLSVKKYFDQASGFLESFTGMFDGLKGALKGMQNELNSKALINIAIAIGLLALALLALSNVNPDNIGAAVTAMALMTGVLMGALSFLTQTMKDFDFAKMLGVSVILILLSVSINILALAVVKLASLSWQQLLLGLGALVVILGALVGAVYLLSMVKNDLPLVAVAMISLATAILGLSTAVLILGNMPFEQLLQGMVALGLLLVGLVGAIMLLSINNTATFAAAAALLAISGAILVLVGAVALLGLIPMAVLVQGMTALAIMLALLVGAILLLSVNNAATFAAAAALLAMAFAVNILVGAIALLGAMPMEVLIQGLAALAITLGLLVVAMYLMTGSLVGAAATLVVAAALIVLAVAIMMLGSMPMDMLIQGLVGLVAAIVAMAVITLILTPIIPLMFLVGVALAAAGVGVLLMAMAMVVFSLGLLLFGPAATLASAGLEVLAATMMKVGEAVPAFLAVGAGLLVFGAGALVAGIGVAVLGAALLLLGTGLALVGAVGIIGVTALSAIVKGVVKLIDQALPMLAVAGSLTALGAALVVLGAGALLAGAGMMLVGIGLLMVGTGAVVGAAGMNLMSKAVEKMAPRAEEMGMLAKAIEKLGSAASKAGDSSSSAASGLKSLGSAASGSAEKVNAMALLVALSLQQMIMVVGLTQVAFIQMTTAAVASMLTFKMGVSSSALAVVGTMSAMVAGMISTVVGGLLAGRGSMYNAGSSIGSAIVEGMRDGLNGGSYLVTAAAKRVAQEALAASKRALGVASPSKEYFKIGAWSDEGLADGIDENSDMVVTSAYNVGREAVKALQESMKSISSVMDSDADFNPTITPVMDLTNIEKNAALINSMLKPAPISVDTSYASAAAIAESNREQQAAASEADTSGTPTVQFVQNNTSPKALSSAEIYRNTKNQLSIAKGVLTT